MPLVPGARLGAYEVTGRLGAGGMGEVYRARDTRLDRTVAIKVLPSEIAGDPQARERFEREARAVAALNHPHICTLHDIGRHELARDGSALDFLVMELIASRRVWRLVSLSRCWPRGLLVRSYRGDSSPPNRRRPRTV
jgi:hypothetical protein